MKFKFAFTFSGLVSMVLLIFWLLSYRSYGLIAREAYSGIGTELASVRGLVVFYYFDNYKTVRPPQYWSFGFTDPKSGAGKRLRSDFDFWQAPPWWSRFGFFCMSSDPFIKRILIISIPYWSLSLLSVIPGVFFYYRLRRSKQRISNASGPA